MRRTKVQAWHDREVTRSMERADGRIRHSGAAATTLTCVLAGLFGAAALIGSQSDPRSLAVIAVCAAAIVRSLFFGIYLAGDQVVVRGLFRARRIDPRTIECFVESTYSGFFTRYSIGEDAFTTRFRMIGIRRPGRRDTFFPSSVMRNRRSRVVLDVLAQRMERDYVVGTSFL